MSTFNGHLTLEMLGLSASVNPLHSMEEDHWFEYPGYFRRSAHCKLEVYERPGQAFRVVIATELPTNDGLSITNAAESLWATVCKKHSIEPIDIVMLEHYPKDNVLDEHWTLVRFTRQVRLGNNWKFEGVEWFHLEKTELERLLGQEI
jgi:hypothetical protein